MAKIVIKDYLQKQYTSEVRDLMSRLIRRIEFGLSAAESVNNLYQLCAENKVPIRYLALFVRSITVTPERFLAELGSVIAPGEGERFYKALIETLLPLYEGVMQERVQAYGSRRVFLQKRLDYSLVGEAEKVDNLPPEKRVAFIMCVNDEALMQESLFYLRQVYLPNGMGAEILPIKGAPSMAAAYNRAQELTSAKYKVYLHQDTLIVNKRFILDCLDIFREASIGVIGMAGAYELPETGVWWTAPLKFGKVLHWQVPESIILTVHHNPVTGSCQIVEAVDGFCLVTQYDLPWRADICDGWHMYDICQCKDMEAKGYKVVVPHQEDYWCIHRPAEKPLDPLYEGYRVRFLEEYGAQMYCNESKD